LPIVRTDLTTAGGLADWDTSASRILLPRQAPVQQGQRRRERFTIAHEIGHFVLRRYLRDSVPAHFFNTHNAEEEYLCNVFAGELLMPTQQLYRDAERFGLTARGVLLLQERYDVSLPVLSIKLAELFGNALFLSVWEGHDDGFTATTVAPRTKEHVELAKSEGTTIHLAALSQQEQSGIDTFYIGGRQARWKCWSIAVGFRRVLAVGLRADLWHRYTIEVDESDTTTSPASARATQPATPGLILQTSLPFTGPLIHGNANGLASATRQLFEDDAQQLLRHSEATAVSPKAVPDSAQARRATPVPRRDQPRRGVRTRAGLG